METVTQDSDRREEWKASLERFARRDEDRTLADETRFAELVRLPAEEFVPAVRDLLHEGEVPVVIAAVSERLASARLRARDGRADLEAELGPIADGLALLRSWEAEGSIPLRASPGIAETL